MSVIVKGMDMPERCGRCFFVRWSNLHQTAWCTLAQEACFEDFSRDYKNRRADFCPLVEIPTPHGRLGDLDALQKQVENTIQDAHMSLLWKQGMMYAHGLVETSKTVIEAEGSET